MRISSSDYTMHGKHASLRILKFLILMANGSSACHWMYMFLTKACISGHVPTLVSVMSWNLDSIFEPMITLSFMYFMLRGSFSRAFSILDLIPALVTVVEGISGLPSGEDVEALDMLKVCYSKNLEGNTTIKTYK